MRHVIKREGLETQFHIDSAGTHGYHVGEAPDHRSVATAARFGVDISTLVARKVAAEDFEEFDLLLALDRGHYGLLARQAGEHRAKVQLFLPYGGMAAEEVPDPYYGSQRDFDLVYSLIERGCEGILLKLQENNHK